MHTDAVQPRPGPDLHEHRATRSRPAEHGLVAHLRPRQRERRTCPASSCSSPASTSPTAASRCWGSGFLPDGLPGRPVPRRRASRSCTCPNPDGRRPRATRRDVARRAARAERAAARRRRRPRDRHAHRRVRDGLPHADERARADRHLAASRAAVHAAVRRRAGQAPRSPTTACWPAGWSSAACASCSSTTAAGTTTATSRRRHRRPPARSSAARSTRPRAALINDLKQRGLLDETLVIWGGEFGRTPMNEGRNDSNLGRDHHPHAFTMWLAGGGVKPGITSAQTDELGYNVGRGPGPRPRPARHDPAPAGPRPHEADLPLPGPRLPPDRRGRQRRDEAARMNTTGSGGSPLRRGALGCVAHLVALGAVFLATREVVAPHVEPQVRPWIAAASAVLLTLGLSSFWSLARGYGRGDASRRVLLSRARTGEPPPEDGPVVVTGAARPSGRRCARRSPASSASPTSTACTTGRRTDPSGGGARCPCTGGTPAGRSASTPRGGRSA